MQQLIFKLCVAILVLGNASVTFAHGNKISNLPAVSLGYVEQVIIKDPPEYTNYLVFVCVAENTEWAFYYFDIIHTLKNHNIFTTQIFSKGSGDNEAIQQVVKVSNGFLDIGEILLNIHFSSMKNESDRGIEINLKKFFSNQNSLKYKLNETILLEPNICALTKPLDDEFTEEFYSAKLH